MDLSLNKKYFRPDEVAALLNVNRRTIYRMILDGRLPGVNLDHRPRRIPRAAITALAAADSPEWP